MALALRALLQKSSPALVVRSLHASSIMGKENTYKMNPLEFKLMGFYKYGLLKDDLLCELKPEVEEAIRRLPEEMQMQRLHRAIRAQQAEISHSILPKEEWTTLEDDHFYLQPYLDEVVKEWEERDEWEATY